MFQNLNYKNGFTLIETLIGAFLLLVVFTGIFGAYQLGIRVVGQSKNKTIALAIASGELEKIKTMPYQSVGTLDGFPEGVLEPYRIENINNVDYAIEIRVDYVVDETDGISAPEDECPNDYKKVEVKVSWSGIISGNIKLTADIAPQSMAQECAEAGGILSVSVFDAFGIMVSIPLIEIRNPETSALIKSATPATGQHFFSLPAGTYKIVVSKTDYSSSRTYGIDEIAIPEKPHPVVLEGALTENSFSIDRVSSFSVDTLSPWGIDYFLDSFSDSSKISEISETAGIPDLVIEGGQVFLAAGVLSGYLISIPIAPESLISWDKMEWDDFEPTGAQIIYQVLYEESPENWVPIPESDLPGNSPGFVSSPLDLSGLNISDYCQTKIKAVFYGDINVSPVLYSWQVSYKISQAMPIPNVPFNLQGEKLIGKDGDEQPVYKYSQDWTSAGNGHVDIFGLEWDSYNFSIDADSGFDLESIEPSPQPIGLPPNSSMPVVLYVEFQNSLSVFVKDSLTSEPIFSASVRLYNSGLNYDETRYTDQLGRIIFIPLEPAVYSLEVQGPGYSGYSGAVSVSGDNIKIVELEGVE